MVIPLGDMMVTYIMGYENEIHFYRMYNFHGDDFKGFLAIFFAENGIVYWDIIGCTIHLMTRFVVHQGFTQAPTGHRRFAHHQIGFEVSMGFGIIAGIRLYRIYRCFA